MPRMQFECPVKATDAMSMDNIAEPIHLAGRGRIEKKSVTVTVTFVDYATSQNTGMEKPSASITLIMIRIIWTATIL